MKTKSLWFATAAAVVLTGMTMMTSCSKDEPLLPEVIESEVYDEGEAGEVRAEVGTEGTQLSYESWIMVRGITRASFDNKVSVTLNNAFNNVDSVIEVGSFNLGECRTELVYEAANSRRQDFVTVTDSLLMYKVTFDVFSFSYNLYHEIGIYDDGITRQTMPYHPIRNVRDNGYTLTDLDFIIEDNGEGEQVVYLRKRFDHSISLDFNGKTYTLTGVSFKRANYTFAGWWDAENQKTYANKAKVSDLSAEGGRVTLVAQWVPTEFAISYKNLSTWEKEELLTSYNVLTKGLPETPSRPGC